MATASALPATWHQVIHRRLIERDLLESVHDQLIQDYRNLALLTSSSLKRSRATAPAAAVPPSSPQALQITAPNSSTSPRATAADASALESELTIAKAELSDLWKAHGQLAPKIMTLTDTLRDRDESARRTDEELRTLREERDSLQRKMKYHREVMDEKERNIQILQDELTALSLELTHVETKNDALRRDNASLLQRWLDRVNEEVDKVNDANQWVEEVQGRKLESTAAGSEAPSTSPPAAGDLKPTAAS